MHRYAKRRQAPNVYRDSYDTANDDRFSQVRVQSLSESAMLRNLARLQKSTDTKIMPTFVGKHEHKMTLCGVIFKNSNGMMWYDFDNVTGKLLSARKIYSTDVISIRREIHIGGLFPVPNDFKVSIRCAK